MPQIQNDNSWRVELAKFIAALTRLVDTITVRVQEETNASNQQAAQYTRQTNVFRR